MQIITNNLIKNEDIIKKVCVNHPIYKNLQDCIKSFSITPYPNGEFLHSCNRVEACIDFDIELRNAKLQITIGIEDSPAWEYILYHELSHIADELNPRFKYSKEKRDVIYNSDKNHVRYQIVEELWNVFIDARLYKCNYYYLRKNVCSGMLDGISRVSLNSIDYRRSFLEARINNSKDIFYDIWDNPDKFMSYDDLIEIMELNIKKNLKGI